MRSALHGVLFAACLLCAQTAAVAQGLPPSGASWKYTWRDQQYYTPVRGFTIEVLDVHGTVVRELFSVDGGEISLAMIDAEEPRFFARPFGNGAMLVELAPYARARDKFAQPPAGYPAVQGIPWDVAPPSVDEDTATVPAGSFKSMRVQVRGTTPHYGHGSFAMAGVPARFIFTAWYSPELKRYVKIRHQTWNRFGTPVGDELVQLMAYRPAK